MKPKAMILPCSVYVATIPKAMFVAIHDHPQDITQHELDTWLPLLPQWRRDKVSRYAFLADKVLCAKAYLLLQKLLSEHYGIHEAPEFEFVAHNKPILADYPNIHFNLSHTKHGVMCVTDNEPIGCDIEDIPTSLDLDLCRYCFNDEEVKQILESDVPCIEFTRLWTTKEAILKLTGEGINDSLTTMLTPQLLETLNISTTVCADKGFVYTICQYKAHKLPTTA